MKAPDRYPNRQRADERRHPEPAPGPAAPAPRDPARTRFVDPYEVRPEAQPEEPGYGHGV